MLLNTHCNVTANVLQSHCIYVAVTLYYGLQSRCNTFAVALQKVYSDFAVVSCWWLVHFSVSYV